MKSEDSPAGHMEESVDDSGPPISDNSITTTSRHVETDAVWDVAELLDEVIGDLHQKLVQISISCYRNCRLLDLKT
ncbi:hypothetical protein CEXT_646051 [Caerostris extrusa]|uniref:Uncharacterized protein n=1 Tax=Caerostris extrusa TaxID=172846 RepID=A0AAV4MEH7_CAEEX|nr:hypothetical protein CEXT_646051 [Caerostris extrusa]